MKQPITINDFFEEKEYKVTRDDKPLFRGTEAECWEWLQKHQGQSADWACKYEGYAVVKNEYIGGIK